MNEFTHVQVFCFSIFSVNIMLISSEEKNSENFSKLVEDDNYYLMLWVKIHLTEQY